MYKYNQVFLLETGTVIHAIGAGLVVAEIQQTSDITYRLYDFDQVDANGYQRELHVDLALEAINYNKVETKIIYNKAINQYCGRFYFTLIYIPLDGAISVYKSEKALRFICVLGIL
jgi:mannose-6-phosphate isomerase